MQIFVEIKDSLGTIVVRLPQPTRHLVISQIWLSFFSIQFFLMNSGWWIERSLMNHYTCTALLLLSSGDGLFNATSNELGSTMNRLVAKQVLRLCKCTCSNNSFPPPSL